MPPRKTPARPPAARNGARNPLQLTATGVVGGGDTEVAALQAAVEGAAPKADTVEFLGRDFRVADDVGLMPLLKFAHAAEDGLQSDDMAGMAALYAVIRDCIHPGSPCTCGAPIPEGLTARHALHQTVCGFDPGDWADFERHAIDQRADGDDLLEVVTEVIEMISARPTRRRSASTRSARRKSPKSRGTLPAQADGLVPVADLLP